MPKSKRHFIKKRYNKSRKTKRGGGTPPNESPPNESPPNESPPNESDASEIEEGRKYFINHGVKSIFIGRFIGPIRSVLPLIAGSLGVNFARFMFYNILSAFAWVLLYITIGYYFGGYFRQIENFISHTSIILTLIIIGGFVYYYYFKKNKKNENQ